jgi:hypothetical protein
MYISRRKTSYWLVVPLPTFTAITFPTATNMGLLCLYPTTFIFTSLPRGQRPRGNNRTVVSRNLQRDEAVNFILQFDQKEGWGRRRLYVVHFSGWQNYMAERHETQQPFITKLGDRSRAFIASHAAIFREMTTCWQNRFIALLCNQRSKQTVTGWP